MKSLLLVLYIISVMMFLYKSIQMLLHKLGFELILGLCLTFTIVPDFMIFDYLGIHISFVFVLLFVYVLPVITFFTRHNGILRIEKDGYLLWTFLFILLIYALITPVIFSNVSEYYIRKMGGYLYSVIICLLIIGAFREEFVNRFEDYCDIILLAIIAYVFKNFYMAGIVNFRYVYETALLEHKNMIFASRILGLGIIICIYMFQQTYKKRYIIPFLLMITQMIMFESRGPILSLVFAAVFIWVTNWGEKKERRMLASLNIKKIILTIIIIVTVCYIIVYLYNNGYLNRLIYKYNYLKMGRVEDRNILYLMCLRILLQFFPFGVGFGNTYNALSNAGSSVLYDYPHNVVLEMFMEDGVLFGFAFIALMISYIWYAVKGKKSRKKALFAALTIFCIANSMFSGDIIGNNWIFVFGMFLSYIFTYENKSALE